jgi:hypothetical protein
MPSASPVAPAPTLKEQLVRESCAMARHLVTNGARVPSSLIQAVDQFEQALAQNKPVNMVAVAGTHERLARLVAPAKPGTLHLLDGDINLAGREASSLGPVKLVRDLVRVAMFCVAVFIALSVVALVDANAGVDLFNVELARGERPHAYHQTLLVVKIVLERVFWLAAAGIGASFAMLFSLNDQIVTRTYDPDESQSYWVKFFLGLVAGFILVALVPIDKASASDGTSSSVQALGPPTIALLGGFSASAVYRILTRMVEALESIFTGGAKEQAATAEKSATIRANEESSQGRMAVAGQLVDLQQKLAAGMSGDQASAHLQQVVAALVPSAAEFQQPVEFPAPDTADKVPAFAVIAAPEDAPAASDAQPSADPQPASASQPVADAQPAAAG